MIIARYSNGQFAGRAIVSLLKKLVVADTPLLGPMFDKEPKEPALNYLVLRNKARIVHYGAHLTIDAPDKTELHKIEKLLGLDPQQVKVESVVL